MNNLAQFNSLNVSENKFKDIQPGWTVKVFQKIKEGAKTRTQAFEGTVLARKHGNEIGATITIRRVSDGYGVEKIFPIHLPSVEKVEVLKKSKVRRSKLYYLRDKSAREIRRKIKKSTNSLKSNIQTSVN